MSYPNKLNLSITQKHDFLLAIQEYFNRGNYSKAMFEVTYAIKERMVDLPAKVRAQLYYIKSLCNIYENKKEDALIDITLSITFNNRENDYYSVRSELLKELGHQYQGVLDLERYLELSVEQLRGNIDARRVIIQIEDQLEQIGKIKTQLKEELSKEDINDEQMALYKFLYASRSEDLKRRLEALSEFMQGIKSQD